MLRKLRCGIRCRASWQEAAVIVRIMPFYFVICLLDMDLTAMYVLEPMEKVVMPGSCKDKCSLPHLELRLNQK